MSSSREDNNVGGRVKRYAKVSAGVGGLAVKYAGTMLFGGERDNDRYAGELRSALGGLKGPIMKVAQMMATIPDALPEEFASQLAELQTNAPPMGWPFVKRRMAAELGKDWTSKFASFERDAAAAASLGQVHRAEHHDGTRLACKLQYPDMQSAVEADLNQLNLLFSIHRRMDQSINTAEMAEEIGARLREELDYGLEASHMALYRDVLADHDEIIVPNVYEDLSTNRLLTMNWLDGRPILEFKEADQEVRNKIAKAMFHAWWFPFSHYGAIHGDPHLGNYSVRSDHGINLLDFGCIRIFRPEFVQGVVSLYTALLHQDDELAVAAYETWGFRNLSKELIETLNIWSGFIYGPLLDDRVRTIADGVSPGDYGRKQAFEVRKRLKELGPVTPPREFVFMDRAAIGLGAVFLHLDAELNFFELFNAAIDGFDIEVLRDRQTQALEKSNVPLPS